MTRTRETQLSARDCTRSVQVPLARMISRWMFILTASLLLLVASNRGQISIVAAQRSSAASVFQLVNQVRAERGLPPFRHNQALSLAAQNQANFNAANRLYGHNGENGSRPLDRAQAAGFRGSVIENVVGGWDLTPEQGVTWWVNSPVHYNTLITTRYQEAGTGYAVNGRQHHYTLVVGRITDSATGDLPNPAQPAGPPAYVAPIVLSEPNEDGSIVHEVKTGQTLWAIAARYHVRLDELRLFNNLAEASFIRPGDLLTIQLADGQEPPPTPTPPFSHIVRQGETLWTIAASYRLDLAELLWLNSLDENVLLRPGDELTIRLAPGESPPPTPTPKRTHIVQPGETAWVIAALYDLTLNELLSLNGLDRASLLHPGDELQLRPVATPTVSRNMADPTPATMATTRSTAEAMPGALERTEPPPEVTPPGPESTTLARAFPTPFPSPETARQNSGKGVAAVALIVAIGFTLLAVVLAGAAYRMR